MAEGNEQPKGGDRKEHGDPVASGHDASDREALVGDTAASERLSEREPVAPTPAEDRERKGMVPAASKPPEQVRD